MAWITYRDVSPNRKERFSQRRYNNRARAARLISAAFAIPISSARRPDDDGLHGDGYGALAWDFGAGTGPAADAKEKKVCEWAAEAKDSRGRHLFQEVLWHGPPNHAHIAFDANIRFVVRKVKRALRDAGR